MIPLDPIYWPEKSSAKITAQQFNISRIFDLGPVCDCARSSISKELTFGRSIIVWGLCCLQTIATNCKQRISEAILAKPIWSPTLPFRGFDRPWLRPCYPSGLLLLTCFGNYKTFVKSVFYENVLAKTVHTEIHIFGPIEIGGDLGSKIWFHKKIMK